MSRTYFNYDPDKQKNKSELVKGLFHNIQILSPVDEGPSDSNPTQEVFASPPRPYSPLPPFIIEEVPITNKDDEPEEYYDKLLEKIKTIYKKLFNENRNISSISSSNYSTISVNDDSDNNGDGSVENLDYSFIENNSPDNSNFDSIIEDKEARQSSASTKSNGYGADFESMNTTIIDVVNNTTSHEDDKMISEEKESDSENIDGDGIRNEDSDNSGASENEESSKARIDDLHFSGGEESHNSIIDDHEMTENGDSRDPEDEQNYENEVSVSGSFTSIILPTRIRFRRAVASRSVAVDDRTEGLIILEVNADPKTVLSFDTAEEDFEEVATPQSDVKGEEIIEKRTPQADETKENEEEMNTPRLDAAEEEMNTPRLDAAEEEMNTPRLSSLRRGVFIFSSAASVAEEEINTPRLDAADDDEMCTPVSPAESAEEETVEPEIHLPEATEKDVEERMGSFYPIEQMRTPRRHLSYGKTSITRQVESEPTSENDEHSAVPQEPSNLTSSTQDGADHNMSELQISNEMNEIFTSIFNESQDKDRTPISGGKIKLVDKSVQTVQAYRVNESQNKDRTPISGRKRIIVDKSVQTVQSYKVNESQNKDRTPISGTKIIIVDKSIQTVQSYRVNESQNKDRTPISGRKRRLVDKSVQTVQSYSVNESQNKYKTPISERKRILVGKSVQTVQSYRVHESQNEDRTPITGRKRKLVDKSVQTVQSFRDTWEEMRTNFVVGTPKIFRLCACTDHICYN